KTKALAEVVKQRTTDWHRDFPMVHGEILRDDFLLTFGQPRIRSQLNRKTSIPESIFRPEASGGTWSSCVETAGENEVLEFLVDMAIGAYVPTQSITAESMR